MSASSRRAIKRPLAAATVALTALTASLLVASPASAAGPWYVAPNGSNLANCTSPNTACASIAGVLGKGGFVSGDTINVAAGTYTGITTFAAKGAKVVGTGNVVLDGNNAGSTIAATGAAPVTLTNLTIRGGLNNSTFGGGLRVQAGTTVTTNDVTITANKSSLGAGAVVYAGGSLTMNGGAVTSNTGASSGGGLYVAGTAKLTGVDVRSNSAVSGGGATVAGGGALTVTNGSISQNTATAGALAQGWGGGVNVVGKTASAAAGILDITGTTLDDNTAAGGASGVSGLGGGVFTSGTTTIKNASMTGNRATGTGASSGYGGGIYHGGAAPAVPLLTLTGTTIAGGGASSNAVAGGGIAATSTFQATGLTLSRNTAQFGGGLYTTAPDTPLSSSTLNLNQATHASAGVGGGVWAARPSAATTSTLTLDDTVVSNNSSAVYGGGLALGGGVTTEVRHGSSIENNTAVVGGGVYTSGDTTIRSSAVRSNSASFQGGGLYNGSTAGSDTPKLALAGAEVTNNTAASGGGGVVTVKNATLTSNGGHIDGNTAIGGGGVLVGDGAPATFDGTDFRDNTASNLGGGAMLNSGVTAISHATISGNHAAHTTGTTGLGAGVYSGSNTANASTRLTIRSSTISGNDAYGASALLTYSPGSGATNTATIDNSTITGNTSTTVIGAIEQAHPLTITRSTITDNTAASGGTGSLYLLAPSQVGIAGTIISGNSGPECSGAVTDGGRNLSDPSDASCGFTPAKNDVAAAPQLGALADNGGPTRTRLPAPASPALDRIPAGTSTGLTDAVSGDPVTLCASGSTDQRGIARPQGAKCDIGAVEVQQVTPTVTGPESADYTIGSAGSPITFTSTGTPQATLSQTGNLPAGVTFHDNGDGTATLSGTPTSGPGGIFTITVSATNEAGTGTTTFYLKLHEAPKLTGPSASTYTVGQAGGPDLFEQISGYPSATLGTTSQLPAGVQFTPQDGGKGTISGTPQNGTGGVYDITITGDNGTPPPATWPFTLTVNESPSLDGPASATFTVGAAGTSGAFTTTGFPKPTLTASGLPNGLSLSGTGTAKITGTPADSTGGEYDLVVKATNGVGDDATRGVHVVVKEAPELDGPTDARLVAGSSGSVVFSSDGYPVAELTSTGTLPAGLSFVDHGNGTASITGTPTDGAVGTYAITIRASNGVAPDSVIHLALEIVPHVSISTGSLPDAAYHTTYTATVSATGGQPPYDFSLESGSLPAGLTLHSDGTITGSATGPLGTSTFKVKVTDAEDPAKSDTRELSIKVVKGATTLTVEPVVLSTSASSSSANVNLNVGVLKAKLTGGWPAEPLAGQTINFKTVLANVCTGTTGNDGKVTCTMSVVATTLVVLNLGATATYDGSAVWNPSSQFAVLAGPAVL